MAYFAKVEQGTVVEVIVASPDFLTKFAHKKPGTWIETFKSGGQRGVFAGVGFTYDQTEDKFYPPKPYNSWSWDETSARWQPPTPYPLNSEDKYIWDEDTTSWQLFENGA